MKKRLVQQYEMAFTSEAFNLAGQSEKPIAPEPARIMAEMTPDERETVRESSFKNDAAFEDAALYQKRLSNHAKGKLLCWHCNALIADPVYKNRTLEAGTFCDEACEDARIEFLEDASRRAASNSMPGLAPGSRWTSQPMAKALSTMQGVR